LEEDIYIVEWNCSKTVTLEKLREFLQTYGDVLYNAKTEVLTVRHVTRQYGMNPATILCLIN